MHRNSRAVELIAQDGRINGVVVEQEGKRREIAASNVVLATGGFE